MGVGRRTSPACAITAQPVTTLIFASTARTVTCGGIWETSSPSSTTELTLCKWWLCPFRSSRCVHLNTPPAFYLSSHQISYSCSPLIVLFPFNFPSLSPLTIFCSHHSHCSLLDPSSQLNPNLSIVLIYILSWPSTLITFSLSSLFPNLIL